MRKKKLLMLGGADIQVSAIKKAKEMGVYVITCDYLPDNPGHLCSDEYYNVSTTEKEAVLELAEKLKIDGILAYASDPAAPTAAFVAEKLGLPTNPYSVVKTLSRKDLFRVFMEENGFKVPKSKSCKNFEEAKQFFSLINKKVIIKPVDSSGSKGIYVLNSENDLATYFDKSMSFSKVGIIILEEFIDKKGFQIGGDGFIIDGNLVFRCFGDIHFSKVNPLLPCSVSFPTLHDLKTTRKVHDYVQKLLAVIGFKMGAVNFDILVTNDDEIYILEIGSRNGGNMIPEITEYCTGVNMIEYSIKTALGEDCSDLKMTYEKKYFSHYVVHCQESGTVKEIKKTNILENHLLYEHFNFSLGDQVEKFHSSANRLGIFLLKFKNKEEMLNIIYSMKNHLKIILKSCKE